MKKWTAVIIVFVLVGLLAMGFSGWYYRQGEVDNLQAAKTAIELELSTVTTELRQQKNAYKKMMLDRDEELRELVGKFGYSQTELFNTRVELKKTEKELRTSDTQLEAIKAEVGIVKSQLPKEFDRGYEKGRNDVLPKKPTYAQVLEMAGRVTVWASSPNTCTLIAMQSREKWREKGWKVGVASVYFWEVGGHMVVVFDTSDRGEVYLDIHDSTFQEVKVERNKSYTRQNGWPGPGFDDTITDMVVMW